MKRELNPSLFGGRFVVDKSPSDVGGLASHGDWQGTAPRESASGPQNYLPMEVKALEAQVVSAKNQVHALEKKLETLGNLFQEFSRATSARFDRSSSALSRLEEAQSHATQDLNGKYVTAMSKINERKVTETKVQELIDRHNQLVRTFENRLTHMQRIMNEQEMQIMNANAALEETRRELDRMKRA